MVGNSPSVLVRTCWFEGDLDEKFLLYGSKVLRFPSDRLIIRGYWSKTSPHYLISASHDIFYIKPANIQEDSNVIVTIVSRSKGLNQRVLSEFSARTGIRGFVKPSAEVREATSKGQAETYLGLEREGLAFLGIE